MFQIRYSATEGGTFTTLTMHPAPTEIDYPERRMMTLHPTQDGPPVIQRPLRDSRSRKWIWKGYGPRIAPYENQWEALKALEYRTRLDANQWPIVELREDELAESGFANWTKVKIVRVERTARKGGGGLVYDESFIEFFVVDPAFGGF
jgi:hypothetical protein